MSKKSGTLMLLLPTAALLVGLTTGCRVEQTQEGKMPEVEVKGGQVPKYDVDTAKVDVKTKDTQVEVPKVEVHKDTATVKVPEVKVTMPGEKPKPVPPPPQP